MREIQNILIKNTFLYNNTKELSHIHILNGAIKSIYTDFDLPPKAIYKKEIDAKGFVCFPGMVDGHTHMRDLEQSFKEDYESGSRACAHGGITTFLDMPNSVPPTISKSVLNKKRRKAHQLAFVNYGFHFGATYNNLREVKTVKNIASLKIYLDDTTGGLLIENEETLKNIFKNSPTLITLHAEGKELIQKAFNLAKKYKKSIYFCHISLEEELILLEKLKKECNENKYPFQIYVEATPHHLFFTEEDLIDEESLHFLAVKPTLKTKKDRDALRRALQNGLLDMVSTDHTPHLLREKAEKIIAGVPGVEHALPFLLHLVSKNEISFERLVEVFCTNPCKIFNIPNKGLNKGDDADLVFVDPTKETLLTKQNIVSKCGWSPFEGIPLTGRVMQTWLKGHCIYNEEKNLYNSSIKSKEVIYGRKRIKKTAHSVFTRKSVRSS